MTIKENKDKPIFATIVSYSDRNKVEEITFNLNCSHEESQEMFDELFGECEFDEVLIYFALAGIVLHPIATNRLVLTTEEGNKANIWIAIRKED